MASTFFSFTLLKLLLHRLVIIILTPAVHASSAPSTSECQDTNMPVLPNFLRWLRSSSSLIGQGASRILRGQAGTWDTLQLIALCALIGAVRVWHKRREPQYAIVAPDGSGMCPRTTVKSLGIPNWSINRSLRSQIPKERTQAS